MLPTLFFFHNGGLGYYIFSPVRQSISLEMHVMTVFVSMPSLHFYHSYMQATDKDIAKESKPHN